MKTKQLKYVFSFLLAAVILCVNLFHTHEGEVHFGLEGSNDSCPACIISHSISSSDEAPVFTFTFNNEFSELQIPYLAFNTVTPQLNNNSGRSPPVSLS